MGTPGRAWREPAVAVAVWLAWAALTPWATPGSIMRIARDDVVYTLLLLLAVVATWRVVARGVPGWRRFWVLMACSNTAWLIAMVVWGAGDALSVEVPTPSIADACLISSYALGLLAVGLGTGSRLRQWRGRIDALIVGVVVAGAGLHWLVRPQITGVLDAETLTLTAYPVLDVAFLVAFVSVIAGSARRLPRSVLLVAGSMVAGTVGDVVLAVLSSRDIQVPDGTIRLLYVPSVLLVLLGTSAELGWPTGGPVAGDDGAGSSRTVAIDLGVAPVLAAVAGVLAWAGYDAFTGHAGRTSFALVLLVVVGLVVRTQLGARDLRRVAQQLDGALEEQRRLAVTDGLTGLYNRRMAEEVLGMEVERAGRSDGTYSVAVVLLDLDHFKQVNDTHGHAAGDLVLTETAIRLSAVLRGSDLLARWGGEEFLAVLPQVGPDDVDEITERLRSAVAERSVRLQDGRRLAVTVSIGAALLDRGRSTPADLLRAADEALYAAKSAGRNCVRHAAPVISSAS